MLPVLAQGEGVNVVRLGALLGISFALTYLNWRGLTLVGRTAIALTVFTIVPFLCIALMAVPKMELSNLAQHDTSSINWADFINIMFWNLNYWDSASTLAGEVENPSKTFPKAIGGAVVLVVCMYLVPLASGLAIMGSDWANWTEGYYAKIAEQVGGKWLALWVVAAAAVSNIGQFQAEMSSDSFQLLGMAERGFIPALFAKVRPDQHD